MDLFWGFKMNERDGAMGRKEVNREIKSGEKDTNRERGIARQYKG